MLVDERRRTAHEPHPTRMADKRFEIPGADASATARPAVSRFPRVTVCLYSMRPLRARARHSSSNANSPDVRALYKGRCDDEEKAAHV